MAGMKSAVFVDGTVNNPTDEDKSWSVEVFIPWSSINQMQRGKGMPKDGEQMRVNFSRVQWTTEVQDGKYVKVPIKGEDKIREYNWVWAPTGVINIHMPEYWGYVQFADQPAENGTVAFKANPDEEIKWILRNLYYRQNEYRSAYGNYSDNIQALLPQEIMNAEMIPTINIATTPSMYEISMPGYNGQNWHIRQDGQIWNTAISSN